MPPQSWNFLIRRHVTLGRTKGSDQAASIEPRGMQELISVINKMYCSWKNKDGKY